MKSMNEITIIVDWVLDKADPSLAFQVTRDLLNGSENKCKQVQNRIEETGYGKLLLEKRNSNGHWGNGAYNPKWTCTHYVIFELMQLGLNQNNVECKESAALLLACPDGCDGGVNYAKSVAYSDVCINGMLLSMCSYFKLDEASLQKIVDYVLKVAMPDGGWNCQYSQGAKKSSLHTTISALEGISKYMQGNYLYRLPELENAKQKGIEFILQHELFKSKTTGEVIKDEFFRYTFPIRWKYDILRCLDYFREARVPYDKRMEEAIRIIENSNNKGRWKGYAQAGKEYYKIERDKWNTLRALRSLSYFERIKLPDTFRELSIT